MQWTTDKDCETEGRQTGDQIPEITGIRRNSQWDFPRRRALFTSDGTYKKRKRYIGGSRSSASGGTVRNRSKAGRQDEDGVEELGLPIRH